jgi:tRNA pseudouridine38-40 synthase
MPRFAMGLEYDGNSYRGWQTQASASSVQAQVEKALSFVAGHPIEVYAAGRTDAQVHATCQVIHFDANVDRGERGWVLGACTELPDDIASLWIKSVPEHFHARYSAESRSYRYVILNRLVRPSLERARMCWERRPLDAPAMHLAAQALIGEHDFSSFRAAECQSSTPMRRVEQIAVERDDHLVSLTVTANAFLHHMVRNIVGVLLAIGRGERPIEWAGEVLAAKDRRAGGVTAPPQGLYLSGVRYPSEFGLPSEPAVNPLPTAAGPRIDAPR